MKINDWSKNLVTIIYEIQKQRWVFERLSSKAARKNYSQSYKIKQKLQRPMSKKDKRLNVSIESVASL